MTTPRQAQLQQGYTSTTDAPVCINCRHRRVNDSAFERQHVCGIGGFRVNNAGTCTLHGALETDMAPGAAELRCAATAAPAAPAAPAATGRPS